MTKTKVGLVLIYAELTTASKRVAIVGSRMPLMLFVYRCNLKFRVAENGAFKLPALSANIAQ